MIIGVSATSANHDIKTCRDAGMTDFISKPYREEALKKVMMRVMGISTPDPADADGEIRLNSGEINMIWTLKNCIIWEMVIINLSMTFSMCLLQTRKNRWPR